MRHCDLLSLLSTAAVCAFCLSWHGTCSRWKISTAISQWANPAVVATVDREANVNSGGAGTSCLLRNQFSLLHLMLPCGHGRNTQLTSEYLVKNGTIYFTELSNAAECRVTEVGETACPFSWLLRHTFVKQTGPRSWTKSASHIICSLNWLSSTKQSDITPSVNSKANTQLGVCVCVYRV